MVLHVEVSNELYFRLWRSGITSFATLRSISAFDTGPGNPFGKVLLGEEVKDDHRYDDHGRERHQPLRLRAAVRGIELLQADGHHAHAAVTGDQQRPLKAVPGRDKVEQRDRDDGRLAER